jgi:predicted permease
MNIKKIIFALTLVATFFLLANSASAGALSQGVSSFGQQVYGGSSVPLQILAAQIIRALLGFLGIIFVAMIIYAGFMYMTSQGKEDVIKKAKNTLVTSIIGLAIILMSYAIATYVTNMIIGSVGGPAAPTPPASNQPVNTPPDDGVGSGS